MKILVTPTSFGIPENREAREKLEAFADQVVYNPYTHPLSEEELIPLLEDVDGYIAGVDYVTAKALTGANRLKVISRYGIGVDRVDLKAAREKQIDVTNTPGANSISVCELAFGMMLCAARNLAELHSRVSAGEWPKSRGIELCGKTLGIIGMGAIGKHLATRALAFGMTVQAYDMYFDQAFADAHGIRRAELPELLATSDFISIHVPYTPETRHLIGRESIRTMRKGAVIINTARGGIVDEEAAAEALRAGQLGGIGLDAFEEEPLKDSPLKGLPNVILTPHTGANTADAVAAMSRMSVENLIDVLSGRPCRYIVN